ncbi:M14 family zinc carboxypeptidase, partial [Calditerricola satsumensis]
MDARYTLADLERDLARLQARYAGLIERWEFGRSVENRPLHAVRVGTGTRCVLLNASHHAREWATTWLAVALLWRYAHAYATDARWDGVSVRALLDRVALVVVPVVNPDGVELATRGPAAVGVPEAQLRAMLCRNGWVRFDLWKANVRG